MRIVLTRIEISPLFIGISTGKFIFHICVNGNIVSISEFEIDVAHLSLCYEIRVKRTGTGTAVVLYCQR